MDGRRELAGVVLGQRGSGKSSLLGRLLCDGRQSALPDEEKSRVEKDVLAAGRADCRYSWLLDTSHVREMQWNSWWECCKEAEVARCAVVVMRRWISA